MNKIILQLNRKNFGFGHIVDLDDVIKESQLFEMDIDDIVNDDNIVNKRLAEGEVILVFRNNKQNVDERYCYLKIQTKVGEDKKTKCLIINKIIIDDNLISKDLFCKIIHIILLKMNNEFNNRIIIGNKNISFRNKISECANEIGEYIYDLFNRYVGENCPMTSLEFDYYLK